MVKRNLSAVLAAAAVAACSGVSSAQDAGPGEALAAYIVQVTEDSNPRRVADDVAATTGGSIRHVYTTVLHGFAIAVPAGITAQDLLADPRVIKVERDTPVSIPRPVEGR